MNTLGPYIVEPFNFLQSQGAENHLQIPVQLSQNGLIEVINLSHFALNLNLQAKGQVVQEPRSKVIYKGVAAITGTQMIDISIPLLYTSANGVGNTLYNVGLAKNNPSSVVFVNSYEEGEIEWYPPVSLGTSVLQSISNFMSSGATTSAITLTLPNTANLWVSTNPIFAACYLTGFDLSLDNNPTSTAGTMTITGLRQQQDGSNTLFYRLRTTTAAQIQVITVRYPDPIPNQYGQNIVLNVPALGGASMTLNAFYFFE